MSEWAQWVEICWGFTKFFFKHMLKISAFYLVKQKNLFLTKIWFRLLSISKQKNFVYWPNFQRRFWLHLKRFSSKEGRSSWKSVSRDLSCFILQRAALHKVWFKDQNINIVPLQNSIPRKLIYLGPVLCALPNKKIVHQIAHLFDVPGLYMLTK